MCVRARFGLWWNHMQDPTNKAAHYWPRISDRWKVKQVMKKHNVRTYMYLSCLVNESCIHACCFDSMCVVTVSTSQGWHDLLDHGRTHVSYYNQLINHDLPYAFRINIGRARAAPRACRMLPLRTSSSSIYCIPLHRDHEHIGVIYLQFLVRDMINLKAPIIQQALYSTHTIQRRC